MSESTSESHGAPAPAEDAADRWVALDFETATQYRDSACALAVAVIENGAVAMTRAWLIKPPGNEYSHWNISIHGIEPSDTRRAPTYPELYAELAPFLDGARVIAHSAPFDISVLRALHDRYRLPLPRTDYVCSCVMARRAFPRLVDHKLPTVCRHCGIPLRHHDAASDALACASIALKCRDEVGAPTIGETLGVLGLNLSRL